jgi:hypothetical protein
MKRQPFASFPELSLDDVKMLEAINSSLVHLRDSRVSKIEIDGVLAESKLAWKLRIFGEVMTYRVVALAESLALNWNAENYLGAYLPARAIIETVAVTTGVERDLERHLHDKNSAAIDALLTNRTFATRDAGWVAESPAAQAVNVMTLISKMDQKLMPGLKRQYDLLSERCHPNYLGHYAMFSTLDVETGATTFMVDKEQNQNRNMIFPGMLLIVLFENSRRGLEELVQKVASLQGAG